MNKTATIFILIMLTCIRSHGASAQLNIAPELIARDASVAGLLEDIRLSVNGVVDLAENDGNYRLFKSGTELKSITDTWEKANNGFEDKVYLALDKPQRQFVEVAYVAAEKLMQDSDSQNQASMMVSELTTLADSNATLFHGKPAVFSYAPRIIYPGVSSAVEFKIRGINFKKADPRIKLSDGKFARRISLSNREAVFSIPLSHFEFDRTKAKLSNLEFGYLSSKKKREWVVLPVLQLPQTLAEFTLQVKTRDSVRDTWEGSRQFYWAGRGESKILSQGPHETGWRIMPASLQQVRVWGEAGKGCSIASNDERGFAIEVRLDAGKKGSNAGEHPYQACEWQWIEYFDRQIISPQAPINGYLTWSERISLPLPVNSASIVLRAAMWDGSEYAISGSQTEAFLEVVKSEDLLEIIPRIPADLNAF
ncbi:hypothetical protein [Methylomonas sp. MgM2]